MSAEVREQLTARCKQFSIHVDDVSIVSASLLVDISTNLVRQTHVHFSPEFAKAIEDKQVAEQLAERAKFVVAKVAP